MSISELAMQEAMERVIARLEEHVTFAEKSLGAGAYARGQKSGFSLALESARVELADYIPLPEGVPA